MFKAILGHLGIHSETLPQTNKQRNTNNNTTLYTLFLPHDNLLFFSCQTQYNLWNQCWGNPCYLAKFPSREKHSSKIIKWATDLFKKHSTSPSADTVYRWPTIFKKTQAFSQNPFQKEPSIIHFLTKDFPNQKCQRGQASIHLHTGRTQTLVTSFPRHWHWICSRLGSIPVLTPTAHGHSWPLDGAVAPCSNFTYLHSLSSRSKCGLKLIMILW